MIGRAFLLPAAVQETLQIFWESPFPATLQDEQFRLVDVNDAFLEFSGFAREALKSLQAGSRPIESQGWAGAPGGPLRRLRAIVRCYRSASGERRYMGIVEDRSVEEERDLARMQIGAMMDTAGVGIATFEESSGWLRQQPGGSGSSSTMLQNINREIVAPESILEYERLQGALKRTQRAEVRYASSIPSSASAGCSPASSRRRSPRARRPRRW